MPLLQSWGCKKIRQTKGRDKKDEKVILITQEQAEVKAMEGCFGRCSLNMREQIPNKTFKDNYVERNV